VERSIAQGFSPTDDPTEPDSLSLHQRVTLLVGSAVVVGVFLIYTLSNPQRANLYDHFVWQASAWLEGQAAIRYPVTADQPGQPEDWFFVDVQPVVGADGQATGRGLLPYPPFPALILLPFVAAFGLATDQRLLGSFIGAFDVGLAFWVLGRLPVRPSIRLATTIFFGVGTVFWYTSMEGTTWFFAHVVAVAFVFAAIALALDGDRAAAGWSVIDDWEPEADESVAVNGGTEDGSTGAEGGVCGLLHSVGTIFAGRQFLAGVFLGLAATARLTVVFGLPFLVLVGAGGTWQRRTLSVVLGMAVPLAILAIYNLVSTGHAFSSVYEAVWQTEIEFYPKLPEFSYLHYHLDWGIEDPRYIPQNMVLALVNPPLLLPACSVPDAARRLFDPECTWLIPRGDTMGLLLTSPAWLLALPTLRGWGKGRLVTGVLAASGAIFIANLMHFSQGWVEFGYRFSNDFAPFLLLCVALGLERLGGLRWWAAALLGASILVNLWGVVWGTTLGW
jgi:hypothetical protein